MNKFYNINQTTMFSNNSRVYVTPFGPVAYTFDLHVPVRVVPVQVEPTIRVYPSVRQTVSHRPSATRSDLWSVAEHGVYVHKDGSQPSANYPYDVNSLVQCDHCDRKNLTAFVHYGQLDLCLNCCERIRAERRHAPSMYNHY